VLLGHAKSVEVFCPESGELERVIAGTAEAMCLLVVEGGRVSFCSCLKEKEKFSILTVLNRDAFESESGGRALGWAWPHHGRLHLLTPGDYAY
jgi:hypothetical protein